MRLFSLWRPLQVVSEVVTVDALMDDELTPTPQQAQPKPRGIEARTGRPVSAYPKRPTWAEAYVEQFSRALGLRRAPTHFGDKEIDL